MDRRFLTVLGVSLIFALVVSTIFYRMTATTNAQAKRDDGDQKDIVVAVKPLNVGVTIKPADVKLKKIPAAQFPTGAFTRIEEVLDRPLISNVLLDEPVLAGRLAQRGSGAGLAPKIPVGMRAVTVRVNDVLGVAGFVLPGLRVDVLVTGTPGQGKGPTTTTVLQNILVLSAGQTIEPDGRGQAIPAPNVTLLVTPAQAEILTLASSQGQIQLVLRNGGDENLEKTPGTTVAALYSSKGVVQPEPAAAPARPRPRPVIVQQVIAAPPPPAPAPPSEIIMIRGNARSVEVVKPGSAN
jgi:pilus assembly protein CpaB